MPIVKQTPPRVAPPVIEHHDNRELRARFPRLAPDVEKHRRPQPQVVTTPPAAPAAVGVVTTPPAPRQNGDGRVRTTQPQQLINRPEQRERPPLPVQADTHAVPGVSVRQGEAPGQGNKPKELKQKKVWKVKTKEQGGDKEPKEKENKGR